MNEDFDHKKAIEVINSKLDSSDKFAVLLERTLKESKIADKAIQSIVLSSLRDDKGCRTEVEKIIAELNNKEAGQFWKNTVRLTAFGMWSIILIVVTTILNHFFGK